MKILSRLFFLILLLSSCLGSTGNRIDAVRLKVYYGEGIEKEEAIKFTKYWKNNNFVGNREQTIQLESEEDFIVIKLIERKAYENEMISIGEEALLQQLERDLRDNVFQQSVEVVITDNTFRPISKRE